MVTQCDPNTSNPPAVVAPIDRSERPGGAGPGRGDLGGHGDLEARVGEGAHLQPGVAQREPVGVPVDGL
jgi:hypothetical protein